MKKGGKKTGGRRKPAGVRKASAEAAVIPPMESSAAPEAAPSSGYRWVGFLLLLGVGFFLFSSQNLKFNLSCTPGAASFKKYDFKYAVDGVEARWAYSDWTPTGKSGPPFADRNIMGPALTIRGKVYEKGIGVQAPSRICFRLDRKVQKFSCLAGMDVNGKQGEGVVFSLLADGKEIFRTPKLTWDQGAVTIQAEMKDVKELILACDPTGFASWCQGDWVNLKFER